jgi:hypothetical protein
MHKQLDAKKLKELKILQIVHPKLSRNSIYPNEKPDFIISGNNGTSYGVEVTGYYQSETSGRFKNIPNYTNRLLKGEFIHKKDIGILEVGTLEVVDDMGNPEPGTKTKGIYQPVSESSDRIDVLKKIVSDKNKKYLEYDPSLEAIDLLIYDEGDLVAGLDIQKTQILTYLKRQGGANTLVSPFRNIILLIAEPGKDTITIYLKSGGHKMH